jgi:hypothetical protein
MNRQTLAVAALLAALPSLVAQETKATDKKPVAADQGSPPNPKTKEHDALKTFAGAWDLNFKSTAPGSDKPTESKGTETAELICGGLFLKSVMEGECEGKQMHAMWLLGYDPFAKQYKGVCVSNHDSSPSPVTGRYDDKTKTWEFSGTNAQGPFKSTCLFKDANTMVETCVGTVDGKESKMEISRTRSKTALARNAAAPVAKAPSKEHEELWKTIGQWDAVLKMAPAPGAPVAEMPGSERVVPICDGHWVWSDFTMQWQGRPFEGHALAGYDPTQKKYVSYWFDSMNPVPNEAIGTYDPASKTTTLIGSARDQNGKPATSKEVTTWKDDDTRHMKMEVKGENNESFEIIFKRKKS